MPPSRLQRNVNEDGARKARVIRRSGCVILADEILLDRRLTRNSEVRHRASKHEVRVVSGGEVPVHTTNLKSASGRRNNPGRDLNRRSGHRRDCEPGQIRQHGHGCLRLLWEPCIFRHSGGELNRKSLRPVVGKLMVYFVRSGDELPASTVTARTTRFALTPGRDGVDGQHVAGPDILRRLQIEPGIFPRPGSRAAGGKGKHGECSILAIGGAARRRTDDAPRPGRRPRNCTVALSRDARGAG